MIDEGEVECVTEPVYAYDAHATGVTSEADEWMAQVRAWARSHPQRDHIVDDSRESIYGDRV